MLIFIYIISEWNYTLDLFCKTESICAYKQNLLDQAFAILCYTKVLKKTLIWTILNLYVNFYYRSMSAIVFTSFYSSTGFLLLSCI